MSELVNLQVELREKRGKEAAKKLRANDYIPAVFYNPQGENISLKVRNGLFHKVWLKAGSTSVVELEFEKDNETVKIPALIWSVDKHPYKTVFIHIDFYGVDLTKEVTVSVPVEITGKPKGAEDGGVMEIYRQHLDLTCLPVNIPNQVLIDVSKLEIGDNINIDDIKLPSGARAEYEENFAVVGLVPPYQEKAEPEAETEEEGAESPEEEASDQEE
ncbi:50S ribosomal protein L25 [Desulfonatronovibrio hydrogenovorans]|uniref:50S ribosomal protein L25 n=1 Tax=Desulfonatronovibrio hydrogenovorans TaxID=53245 RepID=UPI00048F7D53|nr:50S ribosomal protein L25 [Desulfonatronovibrio hydrogenovorans]